MSVIRYTTTHTSFDSVIETKDMLEQFPDFIDWGIEWKKSQPYITLHVYLKDDGSDVLPGNCERVEYELTTCQEAETVIQSM